MSEESLLSPNSLSTNNNATAYSNLNYVFESITLNNSDIKSNHKKSVQGNNIRITSLNGDMRNNLNEEHTDDEIHTVIDSSSPESTTTKAKDSLSISPNIVQYSKQTRKKWKSPEDLAFLKVLLMNANLLTYVEFFKPMKNFWVKISSLLLELNYERNARQCHDRFRVLYAKAQKLKGKINEKKSISRVTNIQFCLLQLLEIFIFHNNNIVLKSHLTLQAKSESDTIPRSLYHPDYVNASVDIMNNFRNTSIVNLGNKGSGTMMDNHTVSHYNIQSSDEDLINFSNMLTNEPSLCSGMPTDVSCQLMTQCDQQQTMVNYLPGSGDHLNRPMLELLRTAKSNIESLQVEVCNLKVETKALQTRILDQERLIGNLYSNSHVGTKNYGLDPKAEY